MAKLLNFFKKSEAFSSGSFFAPGPYKVEEARFVVTDMDGKWSSESTVLQLVLQPVVKGNRGWVADKKRNEGNSITQVWSAGKPEYFRPSKSGTGLMQAGDRETLSESCNFYFFLEHMEKAGFNMDQYDNDCSVLEGYVFKMVEVPAPERNFQSAVDPSKDEEAAKTARKKTVIVVEEVLEEADGSSSGGGKKAAKEDDDDDQDSDSGDDGDGDGDADDAGSGSDESPEELLAQYMKSEVCVKAKATSGVKVSDARNLVFKAMKAAGVEPDSSREVLKLMNNEKALQAAVKAAGWKVEKGIIRK